MSLRRLNPANAGGKNNKHDRLFFFWLLLSTIFLGVMMINTWRLSVDIERASKEIASPLVFLFDVTNLVSGLGLLIALSASWWAYRLKKDNVKSVLVSALSFVSVLGFLWVASQGM